MHSTSAARKFFDKDQDKTLAFSLAAAECAIRNVPTGSSSSNAWSCSRAKEKGDLNLQRCGFAVVWEFLVETRSFRRLNCKK
jgi:hypothetical protein